MSLSTPMDDDDNAGFVLEEVEIDDDEADASDGLVYAEVDEHVGDTDDSDDDDGLLTTHSEAQEQGNTLDKTAESDDVSSVRKGGGSGEFADLLATAKAVREGSFKGAAATRKPQPKRAASGTAKPKRSAGRQRGASSSSSSSQSSQSLTVVDDFIRNFLVKNGLSKTLDVFQSEWHQLQQQGRIEQAGEGVPDVYVENERLREQVRRLKADLAKSTEAAEQARGTWDKFRKERDAHRLNHRRVAQEKEKLVADLKRLRAHYAKYEPMIRQLRRKYEDVGKEKMLIVLERDRMNARIEALENQVRSYERMQGGDGGALSASAEVPGTRGRRSRKSPSGSTSSTSSGKGASAKHGRRRGGSRRVRDSALPPDNRPNAHLEVAYEAAPVESFGLTKTFKGHSMSIADVAVHPKKQVVATVSDDRSWKLWSLPKGELIMSGDGHRDWVGSLSFHPGGAMLATGSGDSTVKLWDFRTAKCTTTFTDHTQAVWDVAFHDTGDFVASCSMDHTVRLWDIHSQRSRQTLRGHVDSVNSVVFQPMSNVLCTASGDKTVSLWDLRSGLCIQTFYGHNNAVNHASFNLQGDAIVSADADGVLKVWDVRLVGERHHILTSTRLPVNRAVFDSSGERIIAASDSGTIKVYSGDARHLADLDGHEDAVQSIALDRTGRFLVSASSDCSFRVWTN